MEIIPFTGFLFEEEIYLKNEKHNINRDKNKMKNLLMIGGTDKFNRFAFYILFSTFKFMICFAWIFVQALKLRVKVLFFFFFFLASGWPLAPAPFVEEVICPQLNCFCIFSQNQLAYLCYSNSGISSIFTDLKYLTFHQYYTVFITIAIQ